MVAAHVYTTYTEAGTPLPYFSYNGPGTRRAILAYERFMADPITEREPSPDEMRLVLDYCAYFIFAPCWVLPASEIRILRHAIQRITTPHELAGWLWALKTIGIGPVWGGL